MYDFTDRIRYSETDNTGRLSIVGLLNYFQDCATFHTTDAGLSLSVLRQRGMAWVLTTWQVVLSRLPEIGERVKITTNPYEVRGFMGSRNFLMETVEGERLAIANSLWTMVDPATGHPTRVAEDIPVKYGMGEPMEMDYAKRKIKLEGEEYSQCDPIPVMQHMVDTNGHMNNSQYVSLAVDCLPWGFTYRQLRVEYKRSAVGGNVLYPRLYASSGRRAVAMADESGKPYAIVEFT